MIEGNGSTDHVPFNDTSIAFFGAEKVLARRRPIRRGLPLFAPYAGAIQERVVPSRREFIQAGLCVSLLPRAIPGDGLAPASGIGAMKSNVQTIYRVISDLRFAPSVAFGLEAERLGSRLTTIQGDITDFWFNELSIRWKEGPIALAGLTAHGPLFCLERFAWDHGLRVVFRAEHQFVGSGAAAHSITGPSDTVARIGSLTLGDQDWPRAFARIATACDSALPGSASVRITTPWIGAAEPDEPLVSWVIAPTTRA